MSWGHFSPTWVAHEGLVRFTGGASTGKHLAALKCYLAIASLAHFTTKSVEISLTKFHELTSCSRPMLPPAIHVLENFGLVQTDRTSRIHRHTLTGFENDAKAFSKVPESVRTTLHSLPNRGESALSAMKLLILFLTFRDAGTGLTRLGHEKIRSYSGVQARHIRPGIDHLVNHQLIHVSDEEPTGKGHPSNVYTVRGDFIGGRRISSSEATPKVEPLPVIAAPAILKGRPSK